MNKTRKDFGKYISLGILGMLGSAGTILADTFFVSNRLGADGLAAMNLAICVFGLINGTGMLFGIGGAIRYTILKAAGNDPAASGTFVLSLLSALTAGGIYSLAGLLFSRPISLLLGANADTLAMCNVYLKTILCLAPIFIGNHLLMAFIRNDGDPGLSMQAMLIGSLTNIVLDYVFMYLLNLGIFGAAIATGIAALISIGISSLHFISKKNHLHFVRVAVLPAELARIVFSGTSSFIMEASSSVTLIIFNLLILNQAGNTGIAAYGIVANLSLMILAVMNGIAHGIQPLISTAHGSGDNKTAKWLYRSGILLTFVVGSTVFCMAAGFAPVLVQCFHTEGDPLLQTLAESGLRLYSTGFLFVGSNCLTTAYLSAAEKTRPSFLIALFRGFIGITAIACLLSALWGMTGIWLAFPTTEGLTLLSGLLWERRSRIKAGGKLPGAAVPTQISSSRPRFPLRRYRLS